MPTIKGITSSDITANPDFTASQNENGGWTATQTFTVIKGGLNNATLRQAVASGVGLPTLDPESDPYFKFLKVSRIVTIRNVPGGLTLISIEFTGFGLSAYNNTAAADGEIEMPQPTFHLRGVLEEVPITRHPKWDELTDDEKYALGELLTTDLSPNADFTKVGVVDFLGFGLAVRNESDEEIVLAGDAIEFCKRIGAGETTYKLSTFEYTVRWESDTPVSTSDLNDLGNIVSNPRGNPPKPQTGREWLMTGANFDQRGAKDARYSNEITYLLSDRNGHDEFLYID